MDRVQVKSVAKTGTVGKFSIESREPLCVILDHNNGSYSVQPFDKLDGAIRKFLAQDMYALPPKILPCNPIDLPNLRYLNTNYSPVKHPFKTSFDIESYNSMWFDQQPSYTMPPLTSGSRENPTLIIFLVLNNP